MKPYSLDELRKSPTFKVQFRNSDTGPWFECVVPAQFISNGLVDRILEQKKLNRFWPCDAPPPDRAIIVQCEQPFDIAEFVHPHGERQGVRL